MNQLKSDKTKLLLKTCTSTVSKVLLAEGIRLFPKINLTPSFSVVLKLQKLALKSHNKYSPVLLCTKTDEMCEGNRTWKDLSRFLDFPFSFSVGIKTPNVYGFSCETVSLVQVQCIIDKITHNKYSSVLLFAKTYKMCALTTEILKISSSQVFMIDQLFFSWPICEH